MDINENNRRNKDKDSYKKFLLVISIIKKYSDEFHMLSKNDISNYIADSDYQFAVNTKLIKRYIEEYNSIYDDYIHISKIKGINYYYYSATDLDVMEAKAIVDLVYSSDFFTITAKNNYKDRIKEMFSSHYDKYFDKNIVLDIEKNANATVFYEELEVINEAIFRKKEISFSYSKPMINSIDCRQVTIAPIDTYFCNNVYYLICQGKKNIEEYVTYRLDYISDVKIIEDSNVFLSSYLIDCYRNKLSLITYMYQQGKPEQIELEFDEDVYSNIIDKFGKDIKVRPCENGRYRVSVKNIINSTFYSWLIGFDGKISICGSNEQVIRFHEFLKKFIEE